MELKNFSLQTLKNIRQEIFNDEKKEIFFYLLVYMKTEKSLWILSKESFVPKSLILTTEEIILTSEEFKFPAFSKNIPVGGSQFQSSNIIIHLQDIQSVKIDQNQVKLILDENQFKKKSSSHPHTFTIENDGERKKFVETLSMLWERIFKVPLIQF